MAWGLGPFGNVSVSRLPIFCSVAVVGLVVSVFMVKPLNVLVLGEQYAESLGVRTVALRNRVLVVTGLLTAATTSFLRSGIVHRSCCSAYSTDGFALRRLPCDCLRQWLSVRICGSVVQLFLHIAWGGIVIPVNVVTPLVGAPVVVYVMMKGQRRMR